MHKFVAFAKICCRIVFNFCASLFFPTISLLVVSGAEGGN